MTAVALDIRAAAEAVSVSVDTLERAIRAGTLRAKRTGKNGGKRLIAPDDLREWFEQLDDA